MDLVHYERDDHAMATIVNTHEAKTHFSKLIERALRGEEIIIARAGKPLVKLTPVEKPEKPEKPEPRPFPFGQMKGKVWIAEDFDDPMELVNSKDIDALLDLVARLRP